MKKEIWKNVADNKFADYLPKMKDVEKARELVEQHLKEVDTMLLYVCR